MTEFVPSGYINLHEALDVIGRELFPSDWTGDEHRGHSGLSRPDEGSEIKHAPQGGGAPGSGPGALDIRSMRAAASNQIRNLADRAYQGEKAIERYSTARHELRVRLESGRLNAVILDDFTGRLHPVSQSLWRRHDADRIIAKNEARIPYSRNTGPLLVKAFGPESAHAKPMSPAKMREAIERLKVIGAGKSLTRRKQADVVRSMFPDCHVTARQMRKILQSIPVRIGRPKKANKKV